MSIDSRVAVAAKPRIVGLLGGVASGKSLVARCLEELGAGRLDADAAGHEVLERPEVKEALRRRWGDGVFDAAGRVDRSAVAKIVFARTPAGAEELRHLEQLTHPLIGQLLKTRAEELARRGFRVLILDAPVMLKAEWDKLCDQILFIDAPRAERLRRAQTRNWSEAEFAAREAAQEPVEEKRKRADFVVNNGGSPEETKLQISRLWPSLVG